AMGNAANWIGIGSYLMVALLGLWLMIRHVFGIGHHHHHGEDEPDDHHDHQLARRHLYVAEAEGPVRAQRSALARAFETVGGGPTDRDADHQHGHAWHGHDHHHHDDHDHAHHHHAEAHHAAHSHVAVTPDQLRSGGWRESLGVVLAIGLRPCSGALVVLVFALSQGVLWAGIVSVFLMGLGTAITVATLAT